jgi:hypothetical protein
VLERVTGQRSAWSAILNREQTPVAILFAGFLCLYLLLASGRVETIDYLQSIDVANQFASHGVVWIVGVPASPGGGSIPGVGGHLYAAHDVGMALILLPMAILQTAHVLPASGALFLETLVNPVSAACLVTLFFVFGRRLGAPIGAAIAGAAVLGTGTLILPYAHTTFDATPTALFTLAGFYLAWRALGEKRSALLFLSSCSLGAAILVRADSIFYAVPATIWVGSASWRWSSRSRFIAWASWAGPMLTAGALTALYDVTRFGAILNNGHVHDPNTRAVTPLWYGWLGLFSSPGEGLLFFAPPLLIAAVGWRRFLRFRPGLGWAILAAVAAYSIFVARLANWSGALAWGPRLMVPAVPLLLLPLPELLGSASRHIGYRITASAVYAAGLVGQLGGALMWVLALERQHGGDPQKVAFHRSVIVWSWEAVSHVITGHDAYPPRLAEGAIPPPVPRWDFWWAGANSLSHRDPALAHSVAALLFFVLFIATALGVVVMVSAGSRPVADRATPGPRDRVAPAAPTPERR